MLGRDGKRTVTVWYVGDDGLSGSQNGRVRVVHSDGETLVRLCIVTDEKKKKKGGGYYEQELVSRRRRT